MNNTQATTNCQQAICLPPIVINYDSIGWFMAGSLLGSIVGTFLLKSVKIFRQVVPTIANNTQIDETVEKIAGFLKFGLKNMDSVNEQDLAKLIKQNPAIVAELAKRQDITKFGSFLAEEIAKIKAAPPL